jgi:hypothetical protein
MKQYSKSIAALVSAGVGGLGTAMLDGNLTQAEVIVTVGAALVAFAGTFAAPANTPA